MNDLERLSRVVHELLSYDPETGVFTWKVSRPHVKPGDIAGCLTKNHDWQPYWQISIQNKKFKAHSLAWFCVHGKWPKAIDHIGGVCTNNKISNLREVTQQENMLNRPVQKNSKTGVSGVRWHKASNKWVADIKHKRIRHHLGLFLDKFEAICARKSAEVKFGFHENYGRAAHDWK